MEENNKVDLKKDFFSQRLLHDSSIGEIVVIMGIYRMKIQKKNLLFFKTIDIIQKIYGNLCVKNPS